MGCHIAILRPPHDQLTTINTQQPAQLGCLFGGVNQCCQPWVSLKELRSDRSAIFRSTTDDLSQLAVTSTVDEGVNAYVFDWDRKPQPVLL